VALLLPSSLVVLVQSRIRGSRASAARPWASLCWSPLRPGLAPSNGGTLTQAYGWRIIQWFLTAFAGFVLTLILVFLRETVGRKAVKSEDEGPKRTIRIFLVNCVKPLKVLGLLSHPSIIVAVYPAGISFAVMFDAYVELQATFPFPPYSFDETMIGLFDLGPTIGYAHSSGLGGRWLDYIRSVTPRKQDE
jgi:predicted MFS family arabinose efflux permease